jgi:aldehyde dehydrogenase (NAD+)
MTNMQPPKLEWAKEWLKTVKSLYINGEWVNGSGSLIESVNPANGQVLGRFQGADARDVDKAVAAARAAFEQGPWARMSRKDRGKALRAIAELIREHHAELATIESLDNGKLYKESYVDDVTEAADLFDYYAGWVDKY